MLSQLEYVENDFQITREKRKQPYNMPATHFHEEYEIYYLVSGEVSYFIGDRVYSVRKNDIVLVPHHTIHRTRSADNMSTERILVNFSHDFLNSGSNDNNEYMECFDSRLICPPPGELYNIDNLFSKMENEYKHKDQFSDKMIKQLLEELLITLTRLTRAGSSKSGDESELYIRDAVNYINAHFDSELSLDMLAKKFAVSKSHFSRKFKEETDIGLNQYITLVRIMNSEKLLRETNLPITEVAFRCGFNDSNYFAAVFKKMKGITPLKYSKIHKEKQ